LGAAWGAAVPGSSSLTAVSVDSDYYGNVGSNVVES
jgi:hypothetical protein